MRGTHTHTQFELSCPLVTAERQNGAKIKHREPRVLKQGHDRLADGEGGGGAGAVASLLRN